MKPRDQFSSLLLILMLVTLAPNAHGYIDGGTGSFILQVAVSSVLGGVFFMRTLWRQVKAKYARKSSEARPNPIVK